MASRTILFVEDDSFVLTMYRNRLQNAGFQVEAAGDGLAAIDLLPRVRPDVVVLDTVADEIRNAAGIFLIRLARRVRQIISSTLENSRQRRVPLSRFSPEPVP